VTKHDDRRHADYFERINSQGLPVNYRRRQPVQLYLLAREHLARAGGADQHLGHSPRGTLREPPNGLPLLRDIGRGFVGATVEVRGPRKVGSRGHAATDGIPRPRNRRCDSAQGDLVLGVIAVARPQVRHRASRRTPFGGGPAPSSGSPRAYRWLERSRTLAPSRRACREADVLRSCQSHWRLARPMPVVG
jgi:hypothetical protein